MRRTFATALAAVLSVSGFVAVSNAAANAAPSAVPIAAPAAEKVFRPEKPPLDPKTKKPIALPRDKAGKLLSNVYHYNGEGRSAVSSPGATQYAVLTSQHNPFRQTTAAGHTLWEMAVLDSAGSAVEIGWTKELAVCGQVTNPCFFAYTQNQTVGQGYAGISNTGWVDNPNVTNIDANTALAYTAAGSDPTSFYQYRIERTPATLPAWQATDGAGWQVTWKPQAGSDTIVGYFPDTHWGANAFTKFTEARSWNEIINVPDDTPCDDSGSGVYGVSTTPSAAQKHVAMSIAGGPPGTTNTYNAGISNVPSSDSPNAFRFWNDPADLDWIRLGGPGFAGPHASTSTSAGTIGSGGC